MTTQEKKIAEASAADEAQAKRAEAEKPSIWQSALLAAAIAFAALIIVSWVVTSICPKPVIAVALDGTAKTDVDTAKADAKKASDAFAGLPATLKAGEKRTHDDIVGLLKPIGTRLDKFDDRIKVIETKPAPTPLLAFKPVAKLIPRVPEVQNTVLLQELLSPDVNNVAMPSAERLIRRRCVKDLVEAYASGNDEMKKRTRFCLSRMVEPAQIWFNQVLDHPDNYKPSIVTAVRKLIGTFQNDLASRTEACEKSNTRLGKQVADTTAQTRALIGLVEAGNKAIDAIEARQIASDEHNAEAIKEAVKQNALRQQVLAERIEWAQRSCYQNEELSRAIIWAQSIQNCAPSGREPRPRLLRRWW